MDRLIVIDAVQYYLYQVLISIVIALIIYAIFRKRWSWLETLIPVFFLLLIPVCVSVWGSYPTYASVIHVW